jgi:O-methyltransferase
MLKQAVRGFFNLFGLTLVRVQKNEPVAKTIKAPEPEWPKTIEGNVYDTSHLVPEGSRFGYCHIDVDVYNSASDVVDWIWEKLIPGGVIVFDDYGFHTCTGITQFVNEQKQKNDRLVIHNLNGHAIMIKVR